MNNDKQTPAVTIRSGDVADWRPEEDAFWASTGKRIAYRNLIISVPALLCGFAVWGMWGIITVQMLNLGFPFTQAELFTLTAIAGISGATMRIPASFLIRIAGGRNTIFLTSALLIIPAFGTGIALQDKTTPLWVFQMWAFLSGIGGGNFACSMSNITGFFPKRLQGTALGLNAGLGNFGVTTMQVLIPLVMTIGIFGAAAGAPMVLLKDSGWILGKIVAGTPTFIHDRNETSIPAIFLRKPIPMILGGVPIGVANPPTDAENEVISIKPVAKRGSILLPPRAVCSFRL